MEDEHAKEPSHNNPEEAADYVKAVNLLLQSLVNDIRGFDHYKRLDELYTVNLYVSLSALYTLQYVPIVIILVIVYLFQKKKKK